MMNMARRQAYRARRSTISASTCSRYEPGRNGKGTAMNETLAVATHQFPKVSRHTGAGINLAVVDLPSHQELHLSLRPLPGERPAQMADRLAAVLVERNATVVRHEVFASIAAYPETMQALRHKFVDFDWPVTWIDGGGAVGGVSGM